MDIERLEELKEVLNHTLFYFGRKSGKTNFPDTLFDFMKLIDEAIARQSVKSEEVAEAIERFEKRNSRLKEVQDNGDAGCVDIETWEKYQGFIEDNNLAITALKEYQPWIPVSERLPEKPEYDWVLVHITLSPDGFVGLPHVAELRRGEWFSTEYDLPIEQILQGTITHWKPLPEPPKGE